MSKNTVEELANRLAKEGTTPALEAELARLGPKRLKGEELEAWHHLWGVAAFRRGDRAAALQRFQEAHRQFPSSGLIAFSLAQEYEFAGRIPEMFALFDRFRFPSLPASHALAQARYAYLWSETSRAIEFTLPILDVYRQLRIVDDNFLYMRRLPFFSVTWGTLGAFYTLRNDLPAFLSLTNDLASRLQDYDFAGILSFLRAAMENDFSGYISSLEEYRKAYEARGIPSGLLAMKAAVLATRKAANPALAQRDLDSVKLTDQDFGWLEDIRLLAGIDILTGHGQVSPPHALVTDFLRRQPLLFEPNHAFDFQLITIQEALKPTYQSNRQRQAPPAA